MNQYKQRIAIERNLIKKINSWFPDNKLHGISWGAINKWADVNKITSNQLGLKKLIEISKMLVSLANRSQEVVDPKAVLDISLAEKEVNKLKFALFEIQENTMQNNA